VGLRVKEGAPTGIFWKGEQSVWVECVVDVFEKWADLDKNRGKKEIILCPGNPKTHQKKNTERGLKKQKTAENRPRIRSKST